MHVNLLATGANIGFRIIDILNANLGLCKMLEVAKCRRLATTPGEDIKQ